jgi:hypothetical protein
MSVRLSMCLSVPPNQSVSFQPFVHKVLIHVLLAYTYIFVQEFFFRTSDPKCGNEPLEISQALHTDRTDLFAFWTPNCTKERPSLEVYHLSCSQENYPPIMELLLLLLPLLPLLHLLPLLLLLLLLILPLLLLRFRVRQLTPRKYRSLRLIVQSRYFYLSILN